MNVNGGLRATIDNYLHDFWGSTKLRWSGFSVLKVITKELGISPEYTIQICQESFDWLWGTTESGTMLTVHLIYAAKYCTLVHFLTLLGNYSPNPIPVLGMGFELYLTYWRLFMAGLCSWSRIYWH